MQYLGPGDSDVGIALILQYLPCIEIGGTQICSNDVITRDVIGCSKVK